MLNEFKNNDVVFNWHELPEPFCLDLKLRDEVFKELQQNFKIVNQKTLFEMNRYVINKVKSSKNYALYNKTNIKNP